MKAPVAAQWADLITFVGMVAIAGPGAEGNPLVRLALAGGLLGLVIAAKAALLVVLAAWPQAVGRGQRAVWLTGTVVGLTGAASNLAAVR